MEEYYPRFMDHAEGMILSKLQSILEESKEQEQDKMEKVGKKKMKYDTSLSTDLFEFMVTQLDAIRESLTGEKLIEFLKRMMDQLVSLAHHLANESLSLDPKNKRNLVVLCIRLNDLTKVAQEFSKFKEHALQVVGEVYAERVDNVLDLYFR